MGPFAAAQALGQIGQAAPTMTGLVPALLQALQDKHENVRRVAAWALSGIGQAVPTTASLVPMLLQALRDKEYGVQHVAIEALGDIGQTAPTTAGLVPALLQALQDKEWDVRKAAAEVLGRISQTAPTLEGLVPALLQALQDKHENVRKATAEALGRIGQTTPTLEGLVPALRQMLQDEDKDVRGAAAEALGRIAQTASTLEGLVPALRQALQDKNRDVRSRAAKALGQIAQTTPTLEGLVPVLLQALQDKDWQVRDGAVQALDQIGQTAPTLGLAPALLQALQDEDKWVRFAAAQALDCIGQTAPTTEGLVPALLQALRDKEYGIRHVAAKALGPIGQIAPTTAGLVPALLQALQDKDEWLRFAAARALGHIGQTAPTMEGLVLALLQALQDKNEHVRNAAAEALGRIAQTAPTTEGVVPALLQALQDKDQWVRRAAAQALGHIGQTAPTIARLIPGLLQKLQHTDKDVRNNVLFVFYQFKLADMWCLHQEMAYQAKLKSEDMAADWLQVFVQYLNKNFPGVIWQLDHLQLIAGVQSERVALADPLVLAPLLAVLQKQWEKNGLPAPPTLAECQGKTARYPAAKKPAFKPTPIPASSIVPARPEAKRVSGSGVLNDALSPAQRLRKKFPSFSPLSTLSRFELNSAGRMVLDFAVAYSDLMFQEPPLGQGSFGAVYRGSYRFETVAIKRFLLDDFSLEQQKKIREEAAMMAAIPSDHIVHLRGICLQAPHYCVVMEYLPQGDLYGLLHPAKNDAPKPLSLSQRYRLAADMAIGLSRLHEHGVLHRDLKSLNVLLFERDGELRAKLGDFGFATLKRSLLHSKDGLVGSLPWLAPEIVKGTGEYSQASDVYSLGLILCELVTGKVPYYGLPGKPEKPSFAQIKEWILAGERPWQYLPEDCPKELAQLIRDCCAENPKDRPAANVVVDRLEKLYVAAKSSDLGLDKEEKKSGHVREIKESKPFAGPPISTMSVGIHSSPLLGSQKKNPLRVRWKITHANHRPGVASIHNKNKQPTSSQKLPGAPPKLEDKKDSQPSSSDPSSQLLDLSSEQLKSMLAILDEAKKTPAASSPKTDLPAQNPAKEDKKNPAPSSAPTAYSPRLFAPAPISSSQEQLLPALQQKLQQLCEDNSYTFSIKRPQAGQLVIQFTAVDSVLAETEEIRKELIALTRTLQKLISDCRIPIKPNQYKPNWPQWTLTIQADPAQLDQLANLLHTASRAYLPPDAKTGAGFFQSSSVYTSGSTSPAPDDSNTVETTCGIQ